MTNWSTPLVWRNAIGTEIVLNGTDAVRSYDLNGKELWMKSPMSTHVIPTPFSALGLLFVSSGYVGDSVRPVYAIKPGGEVAWTLPQGGTYNVSPIVYGDYFYTLFDRGFFTCHDAMTGKEI